MWRVKVGSGARSTEALTSSQDSLRALLQVEGGREGSWVRMLSRDREHARSSPGAVPLGLEEDSQAWNRVWCQYPRAWKGLVRKFVSMSLSFEKQQDCESEKTGALEEAGSPRVEY